MDELACNGNTSKRRERPQLIVAAPPATHRRQMLASIDLNMLSALEALLEHRNVTHAARHLGLSQPSISRALTRLRGIFNDDLLVRGSRGMIPTPPRRTPGPAAAGGAGFDPRDGEPAALPRENGDQR